MSLTKLEEILAGYGKLAVAFSGGVDSTLLLDVAAKSVSRVMTRSASQSGRDETLNESSPAARSVSDVSVLAIMAVTDSFPERERREAEDFCRSRGIRLISVSIHETSDEAYAANPVDRCYICKRMILEAMLEAAKSEGFSILAEGSNVDDGGDYRPGARAVRELGVKSPLAEAGLTKAEIRRLSKERGLPTWNKPSFACLATRIPYGERITEKGLRMIEAAEDVLAAEGFAQYRVRLHGGDLARIEVPTDEIERLMEESRRQRISRVFRELGFSYVSIDIDGYMTGSLNRGLNNETVVS